MTVTERMFERTVTSHPSDLRRKRWRSRPWLLLLLAASTAAAAAVADRHETSGQREGEIFIDIEQILDVVLPPRRHACLEATTQGGGGEDQQKQMASWLAARSTMVPDSRTRSWDSCSPRHG